MTDWIFDPFSSPESDPEFGSLPKPRLRKFLTSHLGLSTDFRSPLREVMAAGLKQRIGMAQRQLDALHLLERHQLLTDAARIKAHHHADAQVRARARAIWPGPLTPEKDWRERCREEIVASRDGRFQAPRLLRRMARSEVAHWPSPASLIRAASRYQITASAPLDLARASFVTEPECDARTPLSEHWASEQWSPTERAEFLRTLAVLHEFTGDDDKAVCCWDMLIQRDAEDFLAHVSRFAIALSHADENAARDAAWPLERIAKRNTESIEEREWADTSSFARALRERAWISRAKRQDSTPAARQLRLDLLAVGEATLTELCLGLA